MDADLQAETETIDLTGLWRFQPDPYDDGQAIGYHRPEHDSTAWRETRVPSTFDRTLPWLAGYERGCGVDMKKGRNTTPKSCKRQNSSYGG